MISLTGIVNKYGNKCHIIFHQAGYPVNSENNNRYQHRRKKMTNQFQHIWKITTVAALSALLLNITQFAGAGNAAAKSPNRSLEEAAVGLADAFIARDFQKISDFMVEDVIAMYPNTTLPVIGRETNRETWRQAFQVYESHPLTVDRVIVSNSKDAGFSYGRWAASGVPDVGQVGGRYVATWAWRKSGWQIMHVSAHIHVDIPPSDILDH
jgi:ketosteroid isomerase-like protein